MKNISQFPKKFLSILFSRVFYLSAGIFLAFAFSIAQAAWDTPVISGTALTPTLWNDMITGVKSTWTLVGTNTYHLAGNVGIGTASPAQKLSVAGTIESTSGGFKFPDGTTQTTATGGATYGFGGAFSTSPCYGCRSVNTFTGDCSCPTGFTAQWLQQFPEGGCGWYTGNMYICVK